MHNASPFFLKASNDLFSSQKKRSGRAHPDEGEKNKKRDAIIVMPSRRVVEKAAEGAFSTICPLRATTQRIFVSFPPVLPDHQPTLPGADCQFCAVGKLGLFPDTENVLLDPGNGKAKGLGDGCVGFAAYGFYC